jgi:glycosyltransferase involved in cell wall biosynthesis
VRNSRLMRILVISNLYPSRTAPAFGTFVATRVAALRSAGAEVAVAAITEPRAHRRRLVKYSKLAAVTVWTAVRASRRGRVDVVEAHVAYPTGVLAHATARALRARLVLYTHGTDVLGLPWRGRGQRLVARELFRRADLVVANSRFTAQHVAAMQPSAGPRTVVVSPGVDLPLFACGPPRQRDDDRRDGILFVGRLLPVKGLAVLLDALAILRVRHGTVPTLSVVGGGDARPWFERRARDLGLQVVFTGEVPPAAVGAAMRRALIVAVPSTGPEALGLVAIEGMAAGAVVIASAVGGLMETVTDGRNGFLVPPGQPEALAAGLARALVLTSRSGEYARLRTAARATAARHAADRMARQSLAIYGERWG